MKAFGEGVGSVDKDEQGGEFERSVVPERRVLERNGAYEGGGGADARRPQKDTDEAPNGQEDQLGQRSVRRFWLLYRQPEEAHGYFRRMTCTLHGKLHVVSYNL